MGHWEVEKYDETTLYIRHDSIPRWCSFWAFLRLVTFALGACGVYLSFVLHRAFASIFLLSLLSLADIVYRTIFRGSDHMRFDTKSGFVFLRHQRPWPFQSKTVIRKLRNISAVFVQTDVRFARLGSFSRRLRVRKTLLCFLKAYLFRAPVYHSPHPILQKLCLNDGELITLTKDDTGTKGFVENECGKLTPFLLFLTLSVHSAFNLILCFIVLCSHYCFFFVVTWPGVFCDLLMDFLDLPGNKDDSMEEFADIGNNKR